MATARKTAARAKAQTVEEFYVDTWDAFHDFVLNPRYVSWAFRGHGSAGWKLETTLARRFRNAGLDPRSWPEQEMRILSIFKRKAHLFLQHIPDDDDSFRWLSMMQHHGAPTRLLDFTWSPYVAAFFALENASDDAAIWAVSQPALFRPISLKEDGRRRSFKPTEVRLRSPGNYEKYFVGNEHSFVIWDSPEVMDQRLVAQSGTFLVPSRLDEPVEDILSRYSNPSEVIVKFVLATSKIREVAMLELYRMNVTYYTLFPGLDGLARSLGYEAEYHRLVNPRTMKRNPGW